MQWPSIYPYDCPPADAHDAQGEVYRYVKKVPPREQDFKTRRDIEPNTDFGDKECMACGVSVHLDVADALRLPNIIPAFRKKVLARAVLTPKWGKLQPSPGQTGESHHTWWIPLGLEPWTLFAVPESLEE